MLELSASLQLEQIFTPSTRSTDNASDFLKGLSTLEKLNVEKTKMTNKGIVALQAALPKAEISH